MRWQSIGMTRLALTLLLPALAVLASCDTSPKPPGDIGVCYHYVTPKGQAPHFNVLARNVPSLEACAADLEAMRLHFVMLGGTQQELTGAYQSKFIFLQREGVMVGDTLNGIRYTALVRSGGQLVLPGAVPQQ